MAFDFIVDCGGDDHVLTYDRGKLLPDPKHHDLDLERALVVLGAKPQTCQLFADAADLNADIVDADSSSHLEWMLWLTLERQMLNDYEFVNLLLDYLRRVMPAFAPFNLTFGGVKATQLADHFSHVYWRHEQQEHMPKLLEALRLYAEKKQLTADAYMTKASAAELEGREHSADQLRRKGRALLASLSAARAANDIGYEVYAVMERGVDITYMADGAMWCRIAKGQLSTPENAEMSINNEERWQIEHLLWAVSQLQKDKQPWPSIS